VNDLIGEGFDLSQAPDGKPWEPLKVRIGGQPLVKTGKLRDKAQSATPTASGIMVTIDLVRAATHQYGATIRAKTAKKLRFRAGRRWVFVDQVSIPARPFLPEGELPPRWRDRLSKVVADKLSIALVG
jgi:phage gpG-like protein